MFSHDKFIVFLSLGLPYFFTNFNMFSSMIAIIIVSIIKYKCGNLSDSCRLIALAIIMSKLLKSAILLECELLLDTCPNQLGYKKEHSADMSIYIVKNII